MYAVYFVADDPEPSIPRTKRIDDYALVQLSAASLSVACPDAIPVLLTNNSLVSTQREHSRVFKSIIDVEINTADLMYERTRLYAKVISDLAIVDPGAKVVFLDSDTLITRDLNEVFSEAFDVGLTVQRLGFRIDLDSDGVHQNTQVSPINGGVIFCRATLPATRLFSLLLERFNKLAANNAIKGKWTENIKKWGGDQFALMSLLGRAAVTGTTDTTLDGILVRFFDCSLYNFTPHDRDFRIEDLQRAAICHFKGRRKDQFKKMVQALNQQFLATTKLC